jgi:AcrR family transcriptional regulator
MVQAGTKTRLSREAWLAEALEVLAKDPEHLRVDELAERLGVSKGSFYWHFENRSDFVYSMAEYWRDTNTTAVAKIITSASGSPEDHLYLLMKTVLENRSAQYDLAVRAWARHEPGILPVIREVDRIRLKTIRGIFDDMGLEASEASMRTRVFLVCYSLNDALSIPLSRKEALEQLETGHAFFTRR